MKLYVKLRESGEVRGVYIIARASEGVYYADVWGIGDVQYIGKECDLCDEQGRLLKPEQLLTDNTICPLCGKEINPISSSEVSVEWMIKGKWYRCHILCVHEDVLKLENAVPIENTMAFAEWIYNNSRLFHETHDRWVYYPNDDTRLDMNLMALYDYWEKNVRGDCDINEIIH